MLNRMRISVGLMLISIVLIAAFQFWWLRKSYREEEETLNIRTSFLFRETIHRLQVSKLKLDSNLKRKVASESDMVGMINVLKEKMRDTVGSKERIKSTVIVSMDKGRPPAPPMLADTISAKAVYQFNDNGKFFNVLLTSDSLQDSLTVKEIQSEFHNALLAEDIKVPFSVDRKLHAPSLQRKTLILPLPKLETAEATIGFLNPITYKLYLRDTASYLLKKISPQIFFSVLLLGITVVSFLTLYRNLRSHQKLASIKNEFISNITHELKTPIATVSVAIEAMKNFNVLDDPKKTREYLEISQNELQRLSLLVDKVLKLSMFEKKEIELKSITAENKPQISTYARLNYQSQFNKTGDINNKDFWYKSSTVGIATTIPLFDGYRRRNRMNQAKTELTQLKYRQEQTKQLATTEQVRAWESFNNDNRQYQITKQNLVLAEQVFTSRKALYTEGVSSLIELLDAEKELSNSRNLYVQAMINVQTSLMNIHKSNGTLLTEFITSL